MELVNIKKKKRQRPDIDNDLTSADNINNEDFDKTKDSANTDFSFNNDHDSAITNLGSKNNKSSSNNNIPINDIKTESRQFNVLYYKDIRLLVIWNPIAKEQDMLIIEVKLAYYKGAKRRLKLWINNSPSPASPLIWSKTKLINYFSTIFFFTKVDNLIFCPITHLVSLAIANEAFKALSLITIEQVFKYKVWGPVMYILLN
jgi:hypothetical protein